MYLEGGEKVSKNVLRIDDEFWHHYIRIPEDNLIITGKYLFFSENKEELEKIAINELENNNFFRAKINTEKHKKGKDNVLCLYYEDDCRKHELADKYKENANIKYRYWKSDEDTLRGKYSEQFLEILSPEEKKEWTREKK